MGSSTSGMDLRTRLSLESRRGCSSQHKRSTRSAASTIVTAAIGCIAPTCSAGSRRTPSAPSWYRNERSTEVEVVAAAASSCCRCASRCRGKDRDCRDCRSSGIGRHRIVAVSRLPAVAAVIIASSIRACPAGPIGRGWDGGHAIFGMKVCDVGMHTKEQRDWKKLQRQK